MNSLWALLNAGHDADIAVDVNNKKTAGGGNMDHGATIIQTNRPQLMLQYLKAKHLHN